MTGESPPFHEFEFSHGICTNCVESAKAHGRIPIDQEVVDYFRRLRGIALNGDLSTCQAALDEGIALGLSPTDLVVTALSGVLNDVGRKWESGEIHHTDEQRATRWCLALLGRLPSHRPSSDALDVVGMLGAGNSHNVGLKLAENVVREAGFTIETLPPDTDPDDILSFLEARHAGHFVISCALPTMIEGAVNTFERLKRQGYTGKMMLTGAAVRRMQDRHLEFNVLCVYTIWELLDILSYYKARKAG